MFVPATRERTWNHNTTQVRDSLESGTLPFDYSVPGEDEIGVGEKTAAPALVLDDKVDIYATDALIGRKTGSAAPGTVAAWFETRALIQDDHSVDILAHNSKTTCYSTATLSFDSTMATYDQLAGLSIADWVREESKGAGVLSHLAKLLAQPRENKLRGSLLARLREWQQEPEDWGPGTRWPAEQAFEEAIAFVSELPEFALPELDMGVAGDGEINFSWNTDDIIIDLGFYGTRPCSYFARDKRDGQKMRDSAFDPADGLPDQLRALFAP